MYPYYNYHEVLEKLGLSMFLTVFAMHLEGKAVLVWLLIVFSFMDYVTGLTSAVKNYGLNSSTSYWGLIKKVGGFVGVGVAVGIDILISYGAARAQINFPITPFGVLALCYLISSEAISILENLAELGVEIPFLSKAVKVLRDKIKSKGD